jgi:hypothetical protein
VVLAKEGPTGKSWTVLEKELLEQHIPLDFALALISHECEGHLETHLSLCFSANKITQEDVAMFDRLADKLHVHGPIRQDMRVRIIRGLLRTEIRAENLPPAFIPNDIRAQFDEVFYLDIPARYQHVLKSGTRNVPGRILISNSRFRFLGQRSQSGESWGPIDGWELSWNKIIKVDTYDNGIDLIATQRKGGGFYFIEQGQAPELSPYVAGELIQLVLRIASRQAPSSDAHRDSRTVPQAVKIAVFARDGGKCKECGATTYLEYDHIIPLSRGGATSINNLQLLCRRCNSKKGGRI